MHTETLITNSFNRKKGARFESLRPFSLSFFFEKVKLERTWMKGKLDSKILVNRPDKKVVLTTIHEDTEIDSFRSDDSVTLQVIGGNLKLHTRKESVNLNEGQLFSLRENINYSLTTREETMFLLTIVNEEKRQEFEQSSQKQ